MIEATTTEGKPVSMKLFDRTMEGLARSLDLRSQNQALISSNIANADTPGYQAQTMEFEGSLAKALAVDGKMPLDRPETGGGVSASDDDLARVQGDIYNEINDNVREDGNTVDRDDEMNKLYENQLMFNAAADLVKKKLALLKYAIADGGSH